MLPSELLARGVENLSCLSQAFLSQARTQFSILAISLFKLSNKCNLFSITSLVFNLFIGLLCFFLIVQCLEAQKHVRQVERPWLTATAFDQCGGLAQSHFAEPLRCVRFRIF